MNKPALLKAIIARLSEELALSLQAAKTAAAGATDEQSKSEGKYDTRGLELSYLAAGQGRQIAEAQEAIEQLRTLGLREFGKNDPIELSAVITLEVAGVAKKDQPLYFLAPRGGGTEVSHAGRDVVVITPQSPLGRELQGRQQGARFPFGRDKANHLITAVC